MQSTRCASVSKVRCQTDYRTFHYHEPMRPSFKWHGSGIKWEGVEFLVLTLMYLRICLPLEFTKKNTYNEKIYHWSFPLEIA